MVYMSRARIYKIMSRSWSEYEIAILRSILTREPKYIAYREHIEDLNIYSQEQMSQIYDKVMWWMRTRGFKPMLQHEYKALLNIQACARRYLVKKQLWFEYELYARLALCDSVVHVDRAVALQGLLKI